MKWLGVSMTIFASGVKRKRGLGVLKWGEWSLEVKSICNSRQAICGCSLPALGIFITFGGAQYYIPAYISEYYWSHSTS